MKRTYKSHEQVLRRFKSDVRKLKRKCEDLKIKLFTFDDAPDYYICVLSSSDYEIGDERRNCFSDNENYFVSPDDIHFLGLDDS